MTPDPTWAHLGQSINCDGYLIRPDLIAMIPFPDTRETEDTARANLQFQADYWRKQGHGGGVAIAMDPIIEQDAGARAVYSDEAGAVGSLCFALISESMFAQAAASVYTGLAKPDAPIQVFAKLEDALPWIDETLSRAKAS